MNNLEQLLGQFNKGSKYVVNTEGMEFKKIKEIYISGGLNIHPALGLIKNTKNEMGLSFAVITNDKLVNVPAHMNDVLTAMYDSPEVTKAFNDKSVYVQFTETEYENKFGKGITYFVNFLTLEQVNEIESKRD